MRDESRIGGECRGVVEAPAGGNSPAGVEWRGEADSEPEGVGGDCCSGKEIGEAGIDELRGASCEMGAESPDGPSESCALAARAARTRSLLMRFWPLSSRGLTDSYNVYNVSQ